MTVLLRRVISASAALAIAVASDAGELGSELSVPNRLDEGQEFQLQPRELVDYGKRLFSARWTIQEGAGRPLSTGTGEALADPNSPLVFPRSFNRVSGPDANSCAGCHNQPRRGGAGDHVANVFVLGQRFDFATFDSADVVPRRGAVDENGRPVTLGTIANERNTPGMFGSGYIEMLARQITADLQDQRDDLAAGESVLLVAKGIEFGTLSRSADGGWDTSGVHALPPPSLASDGPDDPPSLIIRPFHQAGAVVSLREFTNNAFNHHHGMQTVERFGSGDPDGDGFYNEMTRTDVTAAAIFQATLAVPGRVIPRDRIIEEAVHRGERVFIDIGCSDCHVPSLDLTERAWHYSEPNPYNPAGNLQAGDGPELAVDLNSTVFELPRLSRSGAVVSVPAYTDFRLHDITSGAPDDPDCEPLNMHFAPGTADFNDGNCRFLTARLWGVASTGPYFHHGKYSTMREAIAAHAGDADYSRAKWDAMSAGDRDALIEFLKTLQVLPAGTVARIVDENHRPRNWKTTLR